MMLFKLSFKNLRKSIKDYTIYFLTLILGVAIFYVFNALESQQAMTGLAVIVFLAAIGILGYAYYQVGFRASTITEEKAGIMIIWQC